MPKSPTQNTDTTLNAATVAALIGTSATRVHQLATEGRIHRAGRGKFTLGSVADYLAARLAAAQGDDDDAELRAERLRKLKADADLAEIEVGKAVGKLVLASEVLGEWTRLIAAMKSRLLSLPARLGPQVVILPSAQAATELIDNEMRAVLEELADGEDGEGAGA